MEIRILGPLEVVTEGDPVDLPSGKARLLLAALAVHANQVVSTDRLFEFLWHGQPPDSAANTLQTYVAHLRRSLEPDRAPRQRSRLLLTREPGYLLALDPGQIDAVRFERLVGQARPLLGTAPEEAAALLHTALSLWRGEPLSDFTFEPFAQSKITRLTDLRLTALEDRIDAELALGRHAALCGELAQLVCDHPLREGLSGQLMIALYRCGRQAEALRATPTCAGRWWSSWASTRARRWDGSRRRPSGRTGSWTGLGPRRARRHRRPRRRPPPWRTPRPNGRWRRSLARPAPPCGAAAGRRPSTCSPPPTDAAASAARISTPSPRRRSGWDVLPAQVEIALADGDGATARSAAAELAAIATRYAGPALAAAAKCAQARVLLAEGDPAQAATALRRGIALWRQAGAPYETARARVLLGRRWSGSATAGRRSPSSTPPARPSSTWVQGSISNTPNVAWQRRDGRFGAPRAVLERAGATLGLPHRAGPDQEDDSAWRSSSGSPTAPRSSWSRSSSRPTTSPAWSRRR
jgi:DNA-binding SARP family transcriptional activator